MAIWRNRRNPPVQSSSTWLIDYLKGNVFASLTALVMVFGLCAIYGYHFHIEYFPLISIESFSIHEDRVSSSCRSFHSSATPRKTAVYDQ